MVIRRLRYTKFLGRTLFNRAQTGRGAHFLSICFLLITAIFVLFSDAKLPFSEPLSIQQTPSPMMRLFQRNAAAILLLAMSVVTVRADIDDDCAQVHHEAAVCLLCE